MECFDTLFQLMSLRPCTALTSYLLKQHEKKEKNGGNWLVMLFASCVFPNHYH